ncbi:hypothetical protein EPUS_03307 [Endocarpon pusillum Z07020]|uniref:Ribosome recycling factor domain-containing protein n=1 Tax=Endocarpon pusillum (strain Z07020 / HMAS-L-300199) TaxID=1263415 RepID=U1G1B5_ENDPU|nr:uncharacterized protein EPUS_03307 [Endocarpon pusillum Z07020]ERF71027.1 hypothetical protein EPUS_03307 [Endocarpon pusillum Z07020]
MPQSLRLTRCRMPAKLYCERSVPVGFPTGRFSRAITPLSSPLITSAPISHPHVPPSSCSLFSTTSHHLKKGASKARKSISASNTEHIPDNKAQTNRDREIDPYDFSDLEAKIKHQADWLRDSLQKLRTGGRLSAETIEGLQVEIKHGLQDKKVEKLRLGDLATVVPRGGRLMGVMVNEEAHIKPITTSIQSSPYSLTPQPDPQNPLQLNVPIPPPTAESRAQSLADAKREFEKAGLGIREARGQWQKWYQKAKKEAGYQG